MSVRAAPMFPLGTVLFPHAVLPLHVFEPRYRALTRDALAGDQEFGVVLIERGSEVGGGDARFDVGTLAHIVQASELADGRYAMAVVGVSRFRVVQWLPEEPYPRAEISDLVDARTDADTAANAYVELERTLGALHEVYALAARVQGAEPGEPPAVSPDPEQASFEVAALAALGPLDAQRVLGLTDAAVRLHVVRALLTESAEMLRARLGES